MDLQEKERPRDIQDLAERHVFGEIEYVSGAGSVIRVRGTGTEDLEMPVINTGYGFNLSKDYDAEVISFSLGSDTNLKFALPTIPHNKQRQWAVGTGGVQHPTDPERFLEFNDKRTWLKDGAYAFGEGGALEISGNNVTIRGDVTIAGKLNVNGDTNFAGSNNLSNPVVGPGNNTTIPGFSA